MADQKVSDLPSLNGADVDPADLLYIVDSSAGTAGSKKITVGQFQIAPFSGSTADTVLYLNGSKVLSSSSALTFDGTNFATTGTATATKFIPTGNVTAGNGMYLPAANNLAWSINGSEQMRLTSTGLGIGTSTTTNGRLNVQAGTAATGNSAFFINLDGTYNTYLQIQHSSAGVKLLNGNSFSGAANNLIFGNTSTAETMRIDGLGNLGLGVTPSAWGSGIPTLQVGNVAAFNSRSSQMALYSNSYFDGTNFRAIITGYGGRYRIDTASGAHAWDTIVSASAGATQSITQALTLDASGNLQVGTSSGTFINGKGIVIADATAARLKLADTDAGVGTSNGLELGFGGATGSIYNLENGALLFGTNNTERARITSGGDLLVGATSQYGTEKFNVTQASAATAIVTRLSNGPYNNSSYPFIQGYDGTTARFYFPSNGGLYNYQANDSNLSDQRLKTDIQPAPTYLDKICAIPVRTFLFKDQTDTERNLGVIAQEVDAIAPELVNHNGFGETPEGEAPYLGIYQTDLQYALMKCIQEQQALITALTARVAALEAKP